MNVVITHPDLKDPGGVAAYFAKLQKHFNAPVTHFVVGKRSEDQGVIVTSSRMIHDYYHFVRLLKTDHCNLVHLNPSLDFKSFIRDGIFVLLAKMFRKAVVVFFRGWSKPFEARLERHGLWLARLLYGRADAFIVLSEEFRGKLKTWGFAQPIHREVTVTDDSFLDEVDIRRILVERQQSEKWNVLFLSRILRAKGIYETIEAVSLLQGQYPTIGLTVAGEGDEIEGVKAFVRDRNIPNVIFTGYVRGDVKRRLFESAHVFCLPTAHGEGMPNSIAEAMAFGLPVVTRPVGGIVDFFKNEEHGYLAQSAQPTVLAGLIERLFVDRELYKKISLCNHQYAHAHFLASHAASRLERIYEDVIKDGSIRARNRTTSGSLSK
jgi:glycosyltransferase involved in cell wall biosynthesis